MLKISELGSSPHPRTLRVEGSLVGPWVDELRRFCESSLVEPAKLTLDLSDVTFADREGVVLLTKLRTRGAVLLNPTPFVEEQIRRTDAMNST